MKFSIIIPAYNTGKYIKGCLDSLANQQQGDYEMEVLVVDDCSSDDTYQILQEFRSSNERWVKVFKNTKNIGPGATRNVGIENALGDWIIFFDSDDKLSKNALKKLSEYINSKSNDLDIVGYNWTYDLSSNVKNEKYSGRWDLDSLLKSKDELIKDYISLGMDSSIIYTSIKKSLLDEHNVRFRDGLYEDVDFMLKVYFHTIKSGILNVPIYYKNNRERSIINSVSERHMKGFFQSLRAMNAFLKSKNIFTEEVQRYYYHGLLRAVATEVREIYRMCGSKDQADKLYFMLYREYINLMEMCDVHQLDLECLFKVKYVMIADYFFNLMEGVPETVHVEIAKFLEDIKEKNWSCYDLHNSVFLGPDEVRTCCKRFFVENKMRGDAVLLSNSNYDFDEFVPESILKEKRNLHIRINRGAAEECIGCPYLEFKDWKSINELKIEYISFEYTSVCNMRCIYCDDKYYGGKKASYDIKRLLNQLYKKGSLQSCNVIIWGGGEMTYDSSFDELLTFTATNFPNVRQRVFTNATQFSDVVDRFLKEGKILTITSIDAGNAENFYKIRNHRGFKEVLENLKRYSLSRSENMIIKYILIEHNSSLEELRSFASYIQEYSLEKCNFQISFNFKKESVDFDSLVSAIALHTYLSGINARFIFFDDLMWQRVSKEFNMHYDKVVEKLNELNLISTFADRKKYKSVAIWGAGIQAKFLIEKSAFFKKVKVEYLVDNSLEKRDKDFFGSKVLDPKELLNSDIPVLIAAVQNAPQILENFYKLGLDESRLIKNLVI